VTKQITKISIGKIDVTEKIGFERFPKLLSIMKNPFS
jgi:hypothetical protein